MHFFQEEIKMTADTATYTDEAEGSQLVPVQKKENIIGKSLDKLKDTGTVSISYHSIS